MAEERFVEHARDGDIHILRIANPPVNTLRTGVRAGLHEGIAAALREGARAIVLMGEGRMFSAGADIGEFAEKARDPVWQAGNRQALRGAQLAISRAPIPTLAVVDGDCVGAGGGVALACDMRIASSRARFGITPAKLGIVYPLHDIKLLVDLVGPGQARRILYTGELLSADEALLIGLIEMSATVEALSREAELLISRIVENAPSSTAKMKGFVRRILDGDRDDDAESAAIFDAAFAGPDFAEGLAAFAARRKPVFADR